MMHLWSRVPSLVLKIGILLEFSLHPVTGMNPAPVAVNATTIPVLVGGTVILPCQAPVVGGRLSHVSWHRPHDDLQISRDSEVGNEMRGRVRIMGDRGKGEYHLRLKYAKFPDDNGTWWCNVFNGPRRAVTLTVLVPPATPTPQVTPISGIIFQVSSEAWTFTCVAHYAHPPVTLTWRKITGPPAEYSVLPPSVVMAPDYTMSSSSNLMLSPMNHGSVFSCQAQHPTFEGQVHVAEVQFVIADPVVVAKGGKSRDVFQAYQQDITDDNKEDGKVYQSWLDPEAGLRPPELPSVMATFTPGDVAMVTTTILLILGVLLIIGVLWKTRHRWELDVKDRTEYIPVSSKEIEYHTNSSFFDRKGTVRSHIKDGRQHCIRKLTAAGVFLGIIITVLAFIIPVYIKSFAVPVTGVDELVPVLSGSLLWLDCSSEAKSNDNLLEVAWRKNFMKFYNQYSVKHLPKPLGVPVNYTQEGQQIGPRTVTHDMGQISILPITMSDQGLYICEVARMLDDTGRTSFQRKTFAVVVLDGPQVSQALFVLTVFGLLAALALLGLGMYHSLRSQDNVGVKKEPHKEETI